jgi:hypothetical protein
MQVYITLSSYFASRKIFCEINYRHAKRGVRPDIHWNIVRESPKKGKLEK